MDKASKNNPLKNAYVLLLALGTCMALIQFYLVENKFHQYYSNWVFFLPFYVTAIHLLLFYLFNRKPNQKQYLFMLGSALRLFAYIIPTFIYIYLIGEKNQRIFFIFLIFIYYFAFSLTDSILKIKQIKKV